MTIDNVFAIVCVLYVCHSEDVTDSFIILLVNKRINSTWDNLFFRIKVWALTFKLWLNDGQIFWAVICKILHQALGHLDLSLKMISSNTKYLYSTLHFACQFYVYFPKVILKAILKGSYYSDFSQSKKLRLRKVK